MHDTTLRRLRNRLVVATAALSLGCAGEASGPFAHSALQQLAPSSRLDHRTAALGECDILRAPAGSQLVARYFAVGVQIYRWSGTACVFVAPEAVLSADAGGRSKVGTHYAGPTWESVSGSKVVGTVAQRCTPDATAIPWLSLTAVSSEGPGIFHRVTFMQRLHTVGGLAPSAPGSAPSDVVRVPYTADYLFYRTMQ